MISSRRLAGVKLGEMTGGADLNAVKRATVEARTVAKAAKSAAAQYTVKALCDWYVKHQTALGKQSAADAGSIFAKHVEGTEFATMPARSESSGSG